MFIYGIGVTADLVGTAIQNLRAYERAGLLVPPTAPRAATASTAPKTSPAFAAFKASSPKASISPASPRSSTSKKKTNAFDAR